MTTLMTGVTVDADGETFAIQGAERGNRTALVQASFNGGMGNVNIQGRMTPAHSWVTITTFTEDGAEEVSVFPYMRATADTLASATIEVDTTASGAVVA